ncbi:GCN5 family acetyltransferase [Thalassospira profundimaris]|uniref:GCN5 family acetyltransferase n=1 Tax=Thalassospira profundimaris TaxID=502049 RepID=A0A367WR70_9PROT|nr:GNAT family N-acetyltransferase [Thalassospira profundimaris]RCK43867.1 GCN5 family acetyltransferase [Thalassospira profundimaris]
MTEIRLATNHDGDQIGDLIAKVFAEYPGCVFDRAAEFPELDAIADDFAPHGAIWVAENADGRIIGSLGIKLSADQTVAELHKVYLDKSSRGQGLAQQLLAVGCDWLSAHYPACAELVLWTDSRSVAAQYFYRKCGFAQTDLTRELHDLSHSIEWQFRADVASISAFVNGKTA